MPSTVMPTASAEMVDQSVETITKRVEMTVENVDMTVETTMVLSVETITKGITESRVRGRMSNPRS
jgi:hypothetical protein